MRTLVTGGTGYIGSAVVRRLVQEGHDVGILCRPSSTLSSLADVEQSLAVFRLTGKADDLTPILSAFKPVVVFHMATYFAFTPSSDDVARMVDANIAFPASLLHAMHQCGVTHLVNAGSHWQYYDSASYRPFCLHSATKQAFEDVAAYYVDLGHLRCDSLLIYDTYGPRDPRRKLISLFQRQATSSTELPMSPGFQRLDLVHASDVAAAFVTAARVSEKTPAPGLHRYSVASQEPRTLREIAACYEKAFTVDLRIRWGATDYRPREIMCPSYHFAPVPGWQPQITLEQGFRQMAMSNSL